MLQGIKNLFGPLLAELDCVSAVKEAMEFQVEPACDGTASRDQEAVHSLLDDLDCVSAIKEATELQVEACM